MLLERLVKVDDGSDEFQRLESLVKHLLFLIRGSDNKLLVETVVERTARHDHGEQRDNELGS